MTATFWILKILLWNTSAELYKYPRTNYKMWSYQKPGVHTTSVKIGALPKKLSWFHWVKKKINKKKTQHIENRYIRVAIYTQNRV